MSAWAKVTMSPGWVPWPRDVGLYVRLHGALLAYVIPTLGAFVAAQSWFTVGTVVAFGDYAPPFAPGDEYQSHWNQLTDGGGSPSFEIVSLPYYETLQALGAMGFSPGASQRLLLSCLFAGCAAAVVFFAFSLRLSPIAAGVAGLLGAFNALWLTSLPSPVPLAAMVLAALLGGLLLRAGLRPSKGPRVVAFALLSVGLSYVFRNPPHLVLVGAWLVVSLMLVGALGGRPSLRQATGFLARAAPLVIVLNLWWILPVALAISEPGFGDRFAAAGAADVEWTHERASIGNAAALNVFWAWSYPEYFPYAPRLDNNVFGILKFFLPSLAVLGVFLARGAEKRLVTLMAAAGLVVVWIAKGVHPPFPGSNRWFYEHVPGFWLLREPAKALLLLAFILAILGGIAVSRLLETSRLPSVVTWSVGALWIVGCLAYVHPLFTGEVIPDNRRYLPPAHVQVPDEWPRTAALLNREPPEGKVLILPNYNFYQLSTTWGYHGVPFERLLIRRPVLDVEPGGYYRPADAVGRIMGSVEDDLVRGRGAAARRKLEALGVEYVLLRRDLGRSLYGRSLADPDSLTRGLGVVPDLRWVTSQGMLDLYRLELGAGEVFPATPVAFGGSRSLVPRAIEVLPPKTALIMTKSGAEARLPLSGGEVQLARTGEATVWRVVGRFSSGELVIQLSEALRLSVAGRGLPALRRELRFRGLHHPVLFMLGKRALRIPSPSYTWQHLGLVATPSPGPAQVWPLEKVLRVDPDAAGPVGDCRREDRRTPEEVGLSSAVLRRDSTSVLRLSARDHAACVSFPILPFEPSRQYRVRFEYRAVQGSRPRACLWQEGAESCAVLPALEGSSDWRRVDATVTPEPKATGLQLFFYADGSGLGRTVTEYRRAVIEVYEPGAKRWIADAAPKEYTTIDLPAGELSLDIGRPPREETKLNPQNAGPVGDCRREDGRTPEEVGLSSAVLRRDSTSVLRLSARDHAACVSFPILPFEPSRQYRVRFEYRAVQGSRPRACLWQEGAESCAVLPSFEYSPDWRRVDATVTPEPKATGLQLFFYADGAGGQQTISEYRDIVLTPVDPVALLGFPARGHLPRLPRLTYERVHPGEFQVQVSGAAAPFLLSVTETYAPGWRVEAPRGRRDEAEHVLVNGYGNGWLIPWRGTYELRIVYGPDRLAEKAQWASLSGLVALLVWAAFRPRFGQFRRLRSFRRPIMQKFRGLRR